MTPAQVSGLTLVPELVKANDKTLIVQDEEGNYHFAGHIRNAKNVTNALKALSDRYPEFVNRDTEKIKALFEDIFHHNEFTGRSGTFFAYEGLGSIYWHMVSKLLLAVQETILHTRNESTTAALIEKYEDNRKGLSFNKTPDIYGGFPTDPYSHTPKGQGAKTTSWSYSWTLPSEDYVAHTILAKAVDVNTVEDPTPASGIDICRQCSSCRVKQCISCKCSTEPGGQLIC